MRKFTAILAAILVIMAAGCGNNNEKKGSEDEATTTAAENGKVSQVGFKAAEEEDTTAEALAYLAEKSPLFKKYLDIRMSIPLVSESKVSSPDGEFISGIYFRDENCIAMVYGMGGDKESTVIYSTDGSYVIDKPTKTAYKFTHSDEELKEIIGKYIMKIKISDVQNSTFESSEEEYNGVKYDCETISDESGTSKYYFDKTTGELKYLISGESVTEILTLENKTPDDKYFQIPDGYDVQDFYDYVDSVSSSEAEEKPAE